VLDLLASLVEKSLVMLDERDGAARYRMLETMRDYAREKLAASGGRRATAARHCEHFFAVAKAGARRHQGRRAGAVDPPRRADLDNLRAAMALALSGGADPFIAVKFAVALQNFWIAARLHDRRPQRVRGAGAAGGAGLGLAQSWALYVGAALAQSPEDWAAGQAWDIDDAIRQAG
jgi:predicted ATPase